MCLAERLRIGKYISIGFMTTLRYALKLTVVKIYFMELKNAKVKMLVGSSRVSVFGRDDWNASLRERRQIPTVAPAKILGAAR